MPSSRLMYALSGVWLAVAAAVMSAGLSDGLAEEADAKKKAKNKAEAKEEPAGDGLLGWRDLPPAVRETVLGETGARWTYQKAKAEDGAEVFLVTFNRFGRPYKMVIGADGMLVSKEEIVPPEPPKPDPAMPTPDPKTADPKTVAKTPPPPVKKPAPAVVAVKKPEVLPKGLSFTKDIVPILSKNCFNCHGNGKKKGGVALDTNDIAAYISPGKPDSSVLYFSITGTNGSSQMPPGKKLPPEQILAIKAWIAEGAKAN